MTCFHDNPEHINASCLIFEQVNASDAKPFMNQFISLWCFVLPFFFFWI